MLVLGRVIICQNLIHFLFTNVFPPKWQQGLLGSDCHACGLLLSVSKRFRERPLTSSCFQQQLGMIETDGNQWSFLVPLIGGR